MSERQKQIAWGLFLVASFGFGANLWLYFIQDSQDFERIKNIIFCGIGAALSLPSIIKQNNITRAVQVFSIFLAGAYTLTGQTSQEWGAFIMTAGVICAYSYGFYDKDNNIKLPVTVILIFIIILATSNDVMAVKIVTAIGYTIFDIVYLWFLHLMLIEALQRLREELNEKERQLMEKERQLTELKDLVKEYMKTITEATSIIREYAENKTELESRQHGCN